MVALAGQLSNHLSTLEQGLRRALMHPVHDRKPSREVQQLHKLSPSEITEIVEVYQQGGSLPALAVAAVSPTSDPVGPSMRLCGADFFVLALAPWYPKGHSRRSASTALLLFQPEQLFTSLGITSGPRRHLVTARVRREFERAGRDFLDLHQRGVAKPLRLLVGVDGTGVRWWD